MKSINMWRKDKKFTTVAEKMNNIKMFQSTRYRHQGTKQNDAAQTLNLTLSYTGDMIRKGQIFKF
jgi:hypothetical protein